MTCGVQQPAAAAADADARVSENIVNGKNPHHTQEVDTQMCQNDMHPHQQAEL
jgi:hypothetical protein